MGEDWACHTDGRQPHRTPLDLKLRENQTVLDLPQSAQVRDRLEYRLEVPDVHPYYL